MEDQKINIQVQEVKIKSVDISLPHYAKDGVCHFYKVYDKNECIQVCDTSWSPSVGVCSSSLAFQGKSKTSTKLEYELAFKKVMDVLRSK